jgi:hypothetical protein
MIQTHASKSAEGYNSRIAEWLARAVIVSVAGALAWYTWGHWGDFQIDNGREIYVPAALSKGQLLFRDLWYMYGPLAPYLKALLFWIFGVHLTVLFVFGLTLTIGTALVTFEIARQFKLGLITSILPSLFFLIEAFYPFIRNFVFPYSYAASLACFLGSTCLYFVLRHAAELRTRDLSFAAVLAGLVVLTKQEVGFACLVLLGFEVLAQYSMQRSGRKLFENIAVCCAGLLPALIGYGWFVWKLSARAIFFENWISTPGTYFMRTFGKTTMPEQGFRFVPSELLQAVEYGSLAMALWWLIAFLNTRAITNVQSKSRLQMAALALGNLVPAAIIIYPVWTSKLVLDPLLKFFPNHLFLISIALEIQTVANEIVFPKGILFIGVFFLIHAIWKLWRSREWNCEIQEAALAIYAILVALRQMMNLRPNVWECAVFFNVPLFIIFIILVDRIIRWAGRSLDIRRRDFLAGGLLGVELLFLVVLFFPNPKYLPAKLTTDIGTFYTKGDVAILAPQIVSFMKSHTKNGKDILVLPEPPTYYVLAGMQAPTRWYSLMPGYLAPEQEQDFINEAVSNHVRYVLIANRAMPEYGPVHFGVGYAESIYKWITTNYTKTGQFGPVPGDFYPPYIVSIYEKKDDAPGL